MSGPFWADSFAEGIKSTPKRVCSFWADSTVNHKKNFFFFCKMNPGRALARLFFPRFFAVLRFQKKISRGDKLRENTRMRGGEILGRGHLQGILYGAKPD